MAESGNVEAFCYFISMSSGDEKVDAWLKDNKIKFDKFAEWYKGYKRKVK